MPKRKEKTLSATNQKKRLRIEEQEGVAGDEEDSEDLEQFQQEGYQFSSSSLGEIGIVESISLKNFMCHSLLGPFEFGSNVNFIIGNNGSGKSAILTALIVGLGGKATTTNRGLSLKGFVKHGQSSADITIRLRNRGTDAFKGDVYGDSIIIEQRITCDGSRTCKIKSKLGQVVSTKKEELTAILDHFNIQVDNPVSILNQEMSKQFLHSKSEADKYKFFMKATLLEQMKGDYIHIKQTKAITRDQIETQEESLKDLKQIYLQKKERYENLSSLEEMQKNVEVLKHQMAWVLVKDIEIQKQKLKEQIEREENNDKYKVKVEQCQDEVHKAERKILETQDRLDKMKEEIDVLQSQCTSLKEVAKKKSKAYNGQEAAYRRHQNKLKQMERERDLLQERIKELKTTVTQNLEAEHLERLNEMSTLQKRLKLLKAEGKETSQRIEERQQSLYKEKEELDKLRQEENRIRYSLDSSVKRLNQMKAGRSNSLRRFGEHIPELLEAINTAHEQGRFTKKPVGPIGACIHLKDASLAVGVESCLRNFMKTFCCDNYKDEKVLQGIMSRFYSKGNRPQIIVTSFASTPYDIKQRGVFHPEFPSVYQALHIPNPVVANCLIDLRGIETILLIKDNDVARKVMQLGRPPKNCREAFTGAGDQVYKNRYYSDDFSRAKYLGADLEEEIGLIESDLENQKAQLSRFQLHSNSVIDGIKLMEKELQILIAKRKKQQGSITPVELAISELENVEEPQSMDIDTLEEDVQDLLNKIESEQEKVNNAKKDMDKERKIMEEADCSYQDMKNKIALLVEETEPIKEEQMKAEADANKLERQLKNLEKKQNEHQNYIQELQSKLADKEEELQDSIKQAIQICPERLQVERSAKSIDTEINRLRQRLNTEKNRHGNQNEIIGEYFEALNNYKDNSSQVKDLKRFIDRLDNIMNERQARYKQMRRSLSLRCKFYFIDFLDTLKCCGSMSFDHNNEALAISVQPPGRENGGMSDMRSLSGGERSFSTVCFILSLWEITESPFRCLDEFDVYMDMKNRRISMDLMLKLAESQHLRQFMFITPQSTRTLPKSNLIKIHQLMDPERGNKQQSEEDEEASQKS
ncbi:structural maintenance of chromosomes protein 6 [Acipenser ruthenus]|uniref:structural maintenance of chromosomes protein 6 n=1 Tax=Acipenser ruthenus TaxID=7906 RepID=UPI00145A5614|nr:structural maintenance of chromosomes protein 6 [Acipenser ruthenus]